MPYKDPERQREADRRWREANPEKAREARRRRREANPEKQREQSRRYEDRGPLTLIRNSTHRSIANYPLSEQFHSPQARRRVALGGARTPAPRVIDPPTRGASFRDDAQGEAEVVPCFSPSPRRTASSSSRRTYYQQGTNSQFFATRH